jgi:hypothetical protein
MLFARTLIRAALLGAALAGTHTTLAQTPKGENLQVVDTAFRPLLRQRTYRPGAGPVVTVDEAHHNFHTIAGRYRPFARLLEADGFTVRPGRAPLTEEALRGTDILVVANSLEARNEGAANWRLPAYSAFDSTEIATLAAWVHAGGAILLIADHMPFAGAVAPLAAAFGIQFANGYALLGTADPRTGDYPITFRRRDGTLMEHAITVGGSKAERIDSIVSFTGSAFRLTSPGAHALMTLPAGTRLELPIVAWQFSDSTPRISGEGWLQGGTVSFGRGRVAVFGEAAMFSAQRKGAQQVPMGMNAPEAAQNPQFVLNVLHWLASTRSGAKASR